MRVPRACRRATASCASTAGACGSTTTWGTSSTPAVRRSTSGKVSVNDLSGPVGIVDMMAETGEQAESVSAGLYDIFYLGAFIAVNLAVMNMLPIPALDGGRIFFLLVTALIEAITKKKLDPRYEGYVHAAGMILLLALMAYVLFHDIFRIVTKT